MKTMIAVVVTALALSSSAYTTEKQSYLNRAAAYVTNDARRADCAFFRVCSTNAQFLADLDAIIFAKPPLIVLRSVKELSRTMPRTYAAAIAAYAESKPVMVRAARDKVHWACLSVSDRVEWMVEYYSSQFGGYAGMSALKKFKSVVGRSLGKLIVKTLRRQGKAIVTRPDGTSPVKEYADRISAALDAPRFEGLNEILAEMGIKARMDPSRLKTAEEANALIEEIMSGDMELSEHARFVIATALGVEAYNRFIERFNSGN